MGGIAAGVGEHVQLIALEGAIPVDAEGAVDGKAVAGAGGKEALLPAQGHLDRHAAELVAQKRRHRLFQHILLVAKTAAHVGLDHPHARPGQAEGFGHPAAHNLGDLGAGDDDDVVRLIHVGVAGHRLQMAVLHHRRLVVPLELQIRGGDGLLRLPRPDLALTQQVAGWVDGIGPLGQGAGRIRHHRQRLVGHLDQGGGLLGDQGIAGHHDGDAIAKVTHMVGEQTPVFHVPLGLIEGPGVTGGAKTGGGHILVGEHGFDPVQGQRFAGIDGEHLAVGDMASHVFGVAHAEHDVVVGVAGAAGHLGLGIHPLER